MADCQEDETIEHLLQCKRSKQVWKMMSSVGLNIDVNYNAVMYEVLSENFPLLKKDIYWCIISTVVM